MSKNITGVVAWLKGWFYEKTEVNNLLNTKADKSDLQNVNTVIGSLQSSVDNKVDKITGKSLSTNDFTNDDKNKLDALSIHPSTHATSMIVEGAELSNIGSSEGASQSTINGLINQKLGQLSNVDFMKVVQTLPTASSSTMNSLYLVANGNIAGQNTYNIYITVQTGANAWKWEKVDDANLEMGNYYSVSEVDEMLAVKMVSQLPDYQDALANQIYYCGGGFYIWDSTGNGTLGSYGEFVPFIFDSDEISTLTQRLGDKSDLAETIVNIELVPKSENDTGAIRLIYGDEI